MIEIFILSGLSLLRPVDTKTDFNLNKIIATLSLISISSVKKFAGKCPQTYSNLISTPLDESQSWWASMLRAKRLWRRNPCTLPLSVARQLASYSLRHWNLRNLTLQQECYLTNTRDFFRNTHGSIMLPPRQPRVFARLGSLAIKLRNIFCVLNVCGHNRYKRFVLFCQDTVTMTIAGNKFTS